MVDPDPDAGAPSSSGRSETSKPTIVLVIGTKSLLGQVFAGLRQLNC